MNTFIQTFEKKANAYLKAMRQGMQQQAAKLKAMPKPGVYSPAVKQLGDQMRAQYGAKKYIDIVGR